MGKPEQATHCIESAIAINPRKASYHSNLGAAYRALQNWSAAESVAAVLVLDPKSGDTYFNLGTLQIAQGHKEDAKKLWLKSLKYSPNNLAALRALAMMHQETEDFEDAFGYAERALALQPKSKELQELAGKCAFDFALLLRGRKHWKAAAARFSQATQCCQTLLRLGRCAQRPKLNSVSSNQPLKVQKPSNSPPAFQIASQHGQYPSDVWPRGSGNRSLRAGLKLGLREQRNASSPCRLAR